MVKHIHKELDNPLTSFSLILPPNQRLMSVRFWINIVINATKSVSPVNYFEYLNIYSLSIQWFLLLVSHTNFYRRNNFRTIILKAPFIFYETSQIRFFSFRFNYPRRCRLLFVITDTIKVYRNTDSIKYIICMYQLSDLKSLCGFSI